MEQDIVVGDIVALKSGGPIMTVESIENSKKCSCVWINTGMDPQRITVPAVCLKRKKRGED